MRQGELLGLRWMDMDFEAKLIRKTHVVYKGKLIEGLKQTRRTGKPRKHTVGMSPLVEQILGNAPGDHAIQGAGALCVLA